MRAALVAIAACALACASAPEVDPARGALWGTVTLVPRDGTATGGDAYADRRVRDALHFDYSRPSFAVVYAAGGPEPARQVHTLEVEDTPHGPRWRPAHAAVGPADEIVIANRTSHPQIVSAPGAAWLREVAPGETASLRATHTGELAIHALGADATPALVWVAPGAYAAADAAGRYALRGLVPGELEVRAWHPRLPPSAPHAITLRAGDVQRLDFEIGVGRGEGAQP